MNKLDGIREELAVQDYVSHLYETSRYSNPHSLLYHTWQIKKMVSLIELKAPVLDNGCGSGFLAEFIKQHPVVALDFSREMAKLASRRYRTVVRGDSQRLPFSSNYFATVINRGLLHHLPEPHEAVREIHRILVKGGEAFFMEPIWNVINSLPRKIAKKGKHFSQLHKNFRMEELTEVIGGYLEIKNLYRFGYVAYVLLGFPDVLNIFKFFPFKKKLAPMLIELDEKISTIPLLRSTSWGVMIVARKT